MFIRGLEGALGGPGVATVVTTITVGGALMILVSLLARPAAIWPCMVAG